MRVFWILRRKPKYSSEGISSSVSAPTISSTVIDAQNNNYLGKTCSDSGPGRVTKRGYHKLSDGGDETKEECPLHDSETEAMSSFSGTECSDYDPEVDGVGEAESDSESEDALTCNVCDRSFVNTRKLAQHQQRKRHFGCSVCDSIFPTLMTLEMHKESLEHWSDDEGVAQGGGGSDSDSDDDDIRSPTEELERLL